MQVGLQCIIHRARDSPCRIPRSLVEEAEIKKEISPSQHYFVRLHVDFYL